MLNEGKHLPICTYVSMTRRIVDSKGRKGPDTGHGTVRPFYKLMSAIAASCDVMDVS